MCELISKSTLNQNARWSLLMGVSIAALAAYISSTRAANAEDSDRPQFWIEVGGQVERSADRSELFTPPFFSDTPDADLAPMIKAQNPSPYDFGMQGKLSLLPQGSDWVFSISAIYGRSRTQNHEHQQTHLPYVRQMTGNVLLVQPAAQQFGDGQTDLRESHFVLDFQAGKDVGIGLFGNQAKSVVSAGIRFAQFTESASITLNARPYNKLGDAHSKYISFYRSTPVPHYIPLGFRVVDQFRRTYAATAQIHRNSHGVGPSVSWDASVPLAGTERGMTLNVDWGANVAILFGRQRTSVHHKTTGHYYSLTGGPRLGNQYPHRGALYTKPPFTRTSSRSVTIPNVGGFAGMSLKFPNAQVSIGYRADVFFGAIDGGIDSPKSQNRSFYGPFAAVSIGLGG